MIRSTIPTDTPFLVALAGRTGVFKPHELVALQEVLDDYHAVNANEGHRSFTAERDGQPAGFVYFGPVAMTENTWDLWWIAVDTTQQGKGLGAKLLAFAESEMMQAGGRLLTIDTSSLPNYQATRQFYLRNGYTRRDPPGLLRGRRRQVHFLEKTSLIHSVIFSTTPPHSDSPYPPYNSGDGRPYDRYARTDHHRKSFN